MQQKNKFMLLDSVIGWRTIKRENLYKDTTGLSLQKIPGKGKPIADVDGTFGGLDYPTGLAIDKDKNIYITDTKSHIIKKYDFCKKEFITLDCIGGKGQLPRQLCSPVGLAVSKDNNLYVADTGNHRIQVFSLKGLILRDIWGAVDDKGIPVEGSGDGQFNQPTDIDIDNRGNVYVVDKGNKRVQIFSRKGKFLLKFGEEGEAEGKFFYPTHITIDNENRLYIIDEKKKYVQIFDNNGKYLGKIDGPQDIAGVFTPLAIVADNEGNIYIGEKSERRIYKYVCDKRPEEVPSYIGRSTGFKGNVSYLMMDDGGSLYASLADMGLITSFLPEETRYEEEGSFISKPLDSKVYKCRWHRIVIDADIPEDTSIIVRTYTSESKKDNVEIKDISSSRWTNSRINAKDFLVLSPPGRYLWLQVTLKGNISSTPVLKALMVYYPRVSYLRYLPKVYQEDETSRLFLERFLSIFETIFTGFEDEIDNIARYFNPMAVPKEFLTWLASWLALVLDENWPDEKKRELIRRAPELFKKRGTLEGLKEYIRIFTGMSPAIIEHYKLRRWLFVGESTLGCNSSLWSKGVTGRLQLNAYSTICSFRLISTGDPVMDPFHQYAHRFSVVIPSSFCEEKKKERALNNIIEMEKPAHTEHNICKVYPRYRVGVQSTIGVDSIIASYPETILCYGSTLGFDSILGESTEERETPTLSVGKKSRIGVDTVIN